MKARALACANIALVKYWGKRDAERNLPAAGSLSLTLEALQTTTSVEFSPSFSSDQLVLDGKKADASRLGPWLDLVRKLGNSDLRAQVVSENHFPTASGLASSASAYAALSLAGTKALGLDLPSSKLSELARRGSGSAARSLFGGFAIWHKGDKADGSDSIAEELICPGDFEPRMVIAIIGGGAKKVLSSRDAMNHCAQSSPLYLAWLASVEADLPQAKEAVEAGDMATLGELTEGSAMAMHAAALASRPSIRYWKPATLACLDAIEPLRARGLAAHATMDAGPHVKVLCDVASAPEVARTLRTVDGVSEVIRSKPGFAPRLIEEEK